MPSPVIVFDFGDPRHKLLAWFLTDGGIGNHRVTTLPDVIELLDAHQPALVLVNSVAGTEDIASAAAEMRGGEPRTRILIFHDGPHAEREPPVLADLCVHEITDVDDFIRIVEACLENEIPKQAMHDRLRLAAGFLNPASRKWSVNIDWDCGGTIQSAVVELPKVKSVRAQDIVRELTLVSRAPGHQLVAEADFKLLEGDDDDRCQCGCSCS